MDDTLPQTIGIDISKATLDVYVHPAGCERQFANAAQGHKDLINWLGQWQVERIAYESTGAFGFGDFPAPLLKGKWSFRLGKRDIRRFVKRFTQHRISRLGDMSAPIAFSRLTTSGYKPRIGADMLASGKTARIFDGRSKS